MIPMNSLMGAPFARAQAPTNNMWTPSPPMNQPQNAFRQPLPMPNQKAFANASPNAAFNRIGNTAGNLAGILKSGNPSQLKQWNAGTGQMPMNSLMGGFWQKLQPLLQQYQQRMQNPQMTQLPSTPPTGQWRPWLPPAAQLPMSGMMQQNPGINPGGMFRFLNNR